MFNIITYVDAHGNDPVQEFIHELDNRMDKFSKSLLKKISHQMKVVEELGTRAPKKMAKYVRGPIWELRPGAYRIFFFVEGNTIILLHPYRKASNKTPESEKEQAERERKDWISRHRA